MNVNIVFRFIYTHCKALLISVFYPKSVALNKIVELYSELYGDTTMNKVEMAQGKIYYIDFGPDTQIIGRYKESDACNHYFYDLLHYWNGRGRFESNGKPHCVKAGIENIREASKAEKHTLLEQSINWGTI